MVDIKKFKDIAVIDIKQRCARPEAIKHDPYAIDYATGEPAYYIDHYLDMVKREIDDQVRIARGNGLIRSVEDVKIVDIGGRIWLVWEPKDPYAELTREQLVERLAEAEHRLESLDK